MSYEMLREPIGDGIYFSSVTDPKFKHNRLSVSFVLPLSRVGASDNAVVPHLLRKGCRECPDFSSLNARLCQLYGAVLDADVSKYGGYQLLEVSIRGLDNRYALEGEDIVQQCAQLLASVALDPNLDEDGLFPAKDVELERQYVMDTIESQINDKRGYALSRCMQVMCEGEPVAVRRYGYRDTAEKISARSAAEAYRNMLEVAPVEILFTGSGSADKAKEIFRRRFAGTRRSPGNYDPVRLRETPGGLKEKTEEMDLSQGKLVMGFRTGSITTQRQLYGARVFAALFGGTPFSKLFLNVRERLSLCYYCAARFDVATRLLTVDSGVETANKQKAQDEILAQLAAVQRGEFTDEELANTKLLMRGNVRTMTDSLSGLGGWYLTQILRGQNLSPGEDALQIEKVTREDVIQAAGGVALDTVYFLRGHSEQEAAK